MRWLIALGIVVGGVIIGSVLSGQVRRIVGRANRSDRTRSLAQPIGS